MNRLRFLRNERGESLEVVAKYLNVTVQTISNYENEKRDMSPDIIIKLAKYFNVTTDYLLCKSDIRNPEININEVDIAFAEGLKGLNETNKAIIKTTLEALLAKQEKEDKKEN